MPRGALTIFSAHGVSRAVERRGRPPGLTVLDATCPLVAKVHAQGQRYVDARPHADPDRPCRASRGRRHAWAASTARCISSNARRMSLRSTLAEDTPVAYVTQTTLSVDDTKAIIAALERRFSRCCRPGDPGYLLRHAKPANGGARAGRLVDVILVVGAKNSSNSNRLREIGARGGRAELSVADKASSTTIWSAWGKTTIGLTAGASAPEVLVEDVIEALRALGPVESRLCLASRKTLNSALPC